MKGEISKPVIAGAVIVALILVGFLFWSLTKPPEPEVKVPDISKMTTDEIAKMKEADHAADAARGRQ